MRSDPHKKQKLQQKWNENNKKQENANNRSKAYTKDCQDAADSARRLNAQDS
jgi:hypothetical protein